MMKSTSQDINIIILKQIDVHGIEDDDFPLVLRSPNEVDAELDDSIDVKFQLRPRSVTEYDDERIPMAVTAVADSRDDDDDNAMINAMEEEADEDNNFLSLFNDKIKAIEVEDRDQHHHGCSTFFPFTPPPRLILTPRLRPRPKAKAKAALRPPALRRVAVLRTVVRHQQQQQNPVPIKSKNNVITTKDDETSASLSYAAPFPFLGRSSSFKNTSFKNHATPLPPKIPRLSLDLTPVINDSSKK